MRAEEAHKILEGIDQEELHRYFGGGEWEDDNDLVRVTSDFFSSKGKKKEFEAIEEALGSKSIVEALGLNKFKFYEERFYEERYHEDF